MLSFNVLCLTFLISTAAIPISEDNLAQSSDASKTSTSMDLLNIAIIFLIVNMVLLCVLCCVPVLCFCICMCAFYNEGMRSQREYEAYREALEWHNKQRKERGLVEEKIRSPPRPYTLKNAAKDTLSEASSRLTKSKEKLQNKDNKEEPVPAGH